MVPALPGLVSLLCPAGAECSACRPALLPAMPRGRAAAGSMALCEAVSAAHGARHHSRAQMMAELIALHCQQGTASAGICQGWPRGSGGMQMLCPASSAYAGILQLGMTRARSRSLLGNKASP